MAAMEAEPDKAITPEVPLLEAGAVDMLLLNANCDLKVRHFGLVRPSSESDMMTEELINHAPLFPLRNHNDLRFIRSSGRETVHEALAVVPPPALPGTVSEGAARRAELHERMLTFNPLQWIAGEMFLYGMPAE
ncbi:mitogen-activated protein kinase 5-like [Aegilops tauschii subsp. strangulata]|uniref:mitogen-activated protein kinase 5-like n=1 Tax=Aegilops tauschii subsp. strangulata TaxID=200361 RepID=UPI003CC85A18